MCHRKFSAVFSLPGWYLYRPHFWATVDLSTLNKFSLLTQKFGNVLEGFSYTASISDLLESCDHVAPSDNGTPLKKHVFAAINSFPHILFHCRCLGHLGGWLMNNFLYTCASWSMLESLASVGSDPELSPIGSASYNPGKSEKRIWIVFCFHFLLSITEKSYISRIMQKYRSLCHHWIFSINNKNY